MKADLPRDGAPPPAWIAGVEMVFER